MNIVAVIPARSGSKSVPHKNVRIMNGRPMIAYSIEHALNSKLIDRVIVSTDSKEYQDIALNYGAEVPFLRPMEISQDSSLDIEVFQHVLNYLRSNEEYSPDIFVHLRPTHPYRISSDIDAMLKLLIDNPFADSIRSMSLAKQTPYKMWLFDGSDNFVRPVTQCDVEEAYNAPRQILPKAYMQNACIDVIRSSTIDEKSMTGTNIMGYPMHCDFDVDTEYDFLKAERALMLKETFEMKKKLQICCDIDGIIAEKVSDNDYTKATPIEENINFINKLARDGHRVVLHTARGYLSGIDWSAVTEKQMNEWDVRYSDLSFGKPNADIYIDDKFFDLEELKQIIR